MTKHISQQSQWSQVANELMAENLKLASYDRTLIDLLGDVEGQAILDFGSGPGVLAYALSRARADVHAYDISKEMRKLAGDKIGQKNVYASVEEIPRNYFAKVICNLVLCIVSDDIVPSIARNLRDVVNDTGRVYAGFCNPRIFNVAESQLDLRESTGQPYEENHKYKKTKKEGGYHITEEHRPLEWYEQTFADSGLTVVKKHFTPQYQMHGRTIEDFVIFEMGKR